MQPDTITAAEREPERAADQSPPPPRDGRIIGVDAHPDTFTAAVFRGQTPHDAKKLQVRADMDLAEFLRWGAGVDTNIEIASIKAVLSALNRATRAS